MNIISVNSEVKLTQLSSYIARFPQIWSNWKAVRITYNINNDTCGDVHHAVKVITQSYLIGVEGKIYHSENNIHILCKDIAKEVIDETGQQICSLLSDEGNAPIIYKVYDLDKDHEEYARAADQDSNNILLYSSASRFLDRHQSLPYENFHRKKANDLKNLTRVLLVEDDPVTRWIVRNSLKNECEIATAPCANKVYSMYSAFDPELIFLDINLPDNNGYNVLQWIMKNDPGAFVVMFSSQSSLDNILEALEKGASGFIGKPFVQENLLSYVHKM